MPFAVLPARVPHPLDRPPCHAHLPHPVDWMSVACALFPPTARHLQSSSPATMVIHAVQNPQPQSSCPDHTIGFLLTALSEPLHEQAVSPSDHVLMEPFR